MQLDSYSMTSNSTENCPNDSIFFIDLQNYINFQFYDESNIEFFTHLLNAACSNNNINLLKFLLKNEDISVNVDNRWCKNDYDAEFCKDKAVIEFENKYNDWGCTPVILFILIHL